MLCPSSAATAASDHNRGLNTVAATLRRAQRGCMAGFAAGPVAMLLA